MSKIYTLMSNILSAEFPNNSLSAGAWLWSSSILFLTSTQLRNVFALSLDICFNVQVSTEQVQHICSEQLQLWWGWSHGSMSLWSTYTHQHQPFLPAHIAQISFIASLVPGPGRECWVSDGRVMRKEMLRTSCCRQQVIDGSTWPDYFSNVCVGGKYRPHDWHHWWM